MGNGVGDVNDENTDNENEEVVPGASEVGEGIGDQYEVGSFWNIYHISDNSLFSLILSI